MRKLVVEKGLVKDLPAKQYRQVVSAVFDLLADRSPHYAKPLQGSQYRRLAGRTSPCTRPGAPLQPLPAAGQPLTNG
jgi:hypothetical protein